MFQIGSYTYDSTAILGRGTYGIVYPAFKNRIKYAIKKVDNKIKEIDNEVRIHSKLRHRNIVDFIDVIYKDTYTYIITEFCEAGTLQNYIECHAPISDESILIDLLEQIANALKYLYDKGILHRDLKPENILLKSGNTVKLTDFSLATEFYNDSTIFDDVCGSPAYMAPEMKRNGIYTNRGDLWSLGMILYQMKYGTLIRGLITPKTDLDDLMLQLLEENPYKRISWQDFFSCKLIDTEQTEIDQENKMNDDPEDIFMMTGFMPTKSKPINIKQSSFNDWN